MSQDSQLIDVPFGKGVHEKIDKTLLPNGVLEVCQNGIFDKFGALSKRYGFSPMLFGVIGGGSLTIIKRLGAFVRELLVLDGFNLYSYDAGAVAVVLKDKVSEALATSAPLVHDQTGGASQPGAAEVNGVRVVVYRDAQAVHRVFVSVYDVSTNATYNGASAGAAILTNQQVDASGTSSTQPRLVVVGNLVWVLYGLGTNIVGRPFNTNTLVLGAPVTITSTYQGVAGFFDACPLNATSFVVAWYDSGASKVKWGAFDAAGAPAGAGSIAETPNNSIGVVATDNEAIYVSWHSNAAGQRAAGWDAKTFALLFGAVAVNATTVPTSRQTVLCRLSSTSAMIAWEEASGAATRPFLRMRSISNAGALGGVMQSTYSLAIVSKPWAQVTDGVSRMYMVAQNSGTNTIDTAQRTMFLVDLGISDLTSATKLVRVVGSCLQTSAGVPAQGGASAAVDNGGGGCYVAATSRTRPGISGYDMVSLMTFDMATDRRWPMVTFGRNQVIAGGVVAGYDGTGVSELGFHLYPEGMVATPSAVGGSLATGTYGIAVVYDWTDAAGQRDQSTPGIVAGIAVAGPTGSISVTVPNLNLTTKSDLDNGYSRKVVVSLYATDPTGLIYYFVTSATNDPTSSTDITMSVFSVSTTAPQLYTTGGVLENAAVPPSALCVVHQNRLWLVNGDDPKALRYSKEFVVGVAPEFNQGLEFRIDKGGDITGLAVIDEKLIVYKRDHIFAVIGSGALATGVQDTLQAAEIHNEGVGCVDWRSIVAVPDGVFFQSNKGLYKLDRSFNALTYVGGAVETELATYPNIVGAAAMANGRTVLVAVANAAGTAGEMLAYDMLVGEWSTWTPSFATATTPSGAAPRAVVNNGTTIVYATNELAANGSNTADAPLFYYDTTLYADDLTQYIPLHWRTGPMRLAGQQARQRVRRVRLLNTWKSAHQFTVVQANNYPEISQTPRTLNPAPGGQIEYFPHPQRCEAISIEGYDSAISAAGEGYSISGLQLEVAPIGGGYKLPASARL